MKKIYFIAIIYFFASMPNSFAQCTINYLTNPSFEAPVQPALGNNFPAPYNVFGGWTISSATAGVPVGGFNVVKVDGTVYSGGPNNAHNGGNQYVDVNGAAGVVQQSFTVTCASTIEYSGWFSRREPGGSNFTSTMDVIDAANTVISTSTSVSFTSSESEEVWKQVTGTASGLAPGTYTLRFNMDDYANVDDAFLCVSPGCILPINLVDFSGSSNKCATTLKWKTASETNTKEFNVEYSLDAINFKKVGVVSAKNASSGADYIFNANSMGEGKVFYRVKFIDNDGTFTYSKIIPIASDCSNASISVYPNLATDFIRVFTANNKFSYATIYNTDGKVVLAKALSSGENILGIGNLAKGMYVIKVSGESVTKSFRIVKL
jgi:Secretion system C-terminal sorting domain